jgi:hypothetical protein
MSRINIQNLSGVSTLTRSEMSGTTGALKLRPPVKCRIELVTVRGPFGIKIRLPKLVCRLQSPVVF